MATISTTASPREDQLTATIESQTSKIPSGAYLAAALGSIARSAILKIAGKNHSALFVGQWAAPFLLFGVYNKIVKETNSQRGGWNHQAAME